jgi:hypothetical protein
VGQCFTELEWQGEQFRTAEVVGGQPLGWRLVRRREHPVEECAGVRELPGLDQDVRFLEEAMVSAVRTQVLDHGVIRTHPGLSLADVTVQILVGGGEHGIERLQHLRIDALAGNRHGGWDSGTRWAAPPA